MTISITNVVQSTDIFLAIFIIALLLSLRKRKAGNFFSSAVTQELKGLAILMVVFSHISYFLVSDNRFLYPLGTMAGVGVNIFLLLSGFGLAISAIRSPLGTWQFYKKRLLKLFSPLWLFLPLVYLADYFILNHDYGWEYVLRSLAGLYPHADLYLDVNSPLWYFGFTLLYYLAFPIIFTRRAPWFSAVLLYLGGYWFISAKPHYFAEVLRLYEVHIMAFPLGVLIGSYWSEDRLKSLIDKLQAWLGKNSAFIPYPLSLILLGALYYAWLYPGIGVSPEMEQRMSIITTMILLAIFIIKRFEVKLFYWFGVYSFEIYLWHWPLMYRYDYLYRSLPGWLATSIYLILFLAIGYIFSKVVNFISNFISSRVSSRI